MQVGEQAADGLVHGPGQTFVVGLEARVRIPGSGAAAAMLNLDEPHAPLDHSARSEQLATELAAVRQVQAVERLCFGRFFGEVDHLRHR